MIIVGDPGSIMIHDHDQRHFAHTQLLYTTRNGYARVTVESLMMLPFRMIRAARLRYHQIVQGQDENDPGPGEELMETIAERLPFAVNESEDEAGFTEDRQPGGEHRLMDGADFFFYYLYVMRDDAPQHSPESLDRDWRAHPARVTADSLSRLLIWLEPRKWTPVPSDMDESDRDYFGVNSPDPVVQLHADIPDEYASLRDRAPDELDQLPDDVVTDQAPLIAIRPQREPEQTIDGTRDLVEALNNHLERDRSRIRTTDRAILLSIDEILKDCLLQEMHGGFDYEALRSERALKNDRH